MANEGSGRSPSEEARGFNAAPATQDQAHVIAGSARLARSLASVARAGPTPPWLCREVGAVADPLVHGLICALSTLPMEIVDLLLDASQNRIDRAVVLVGFTESS